MVFNLFSGRPHNHAGRSAQPLARSSYSRRGTGRIDIRGKLFCLTGKRQKFQGHGVIMPGARGEPRSGFPAWPSAHRIAGTTSVLRLQRVAHYQRPRGGDRRPAGDSSRSFRSSSAGSSDGRGNYAVDGRYAGGELSGAGSKSVGVMRHAAGTARFFVFDV